MTWYQPRDLTEALEIISRDHPVIVCGGTDVFVNWPRRKQEYAGRDWLDIHRLESLRQIHQDSNGLFIGAAVTASEIWESLMCLQIPALQKAARVIGGWQIQNRASIAGNLANASPAADMVVPLVAYGATVVLQSKDGQREVPVQDFLIGPKQTAIRNNEMITAVHVPAGVLNTRQSFLRHDQRGGTDISLVSVAMTLHKNSGETLGVRIAVGAASPVPYSLPDADSMLRGNAQPEVIDYVARRYAEASRPITDVRSSANYRQAMVTVFVKRAIQEVLGS